MTIFYIVTAFILFIFMMRMEELSTCDGSVAVCDGSVAVEDWRYIPRIPNIEVSPENDIWFYTWGERSIEGSIEREEQ